MQRGGSASEGKAGPGPGPVGQVSALGSWRPIWAKGQQGLSTGGNAELGIEG